MNTWVVPGYAEERELGKGATGRVVAAVDSRSGHRVAVKYLGPALFADADFLAGFREEARILRALDVPQVVRLFDYVEVPGQGAAIVMELIDGVSLHQLIVRQGPTDPETALAVLKGSLLGLAAAHEAGIVHRDYKPENVLVDVEGASKLSDFGVAVPAGRQAPAVGTPLYMAPEQWQGWPASPATDIYAAAAVFFECLTGATPFTGRIGQLRSQHLTMAVPVEEVDEPVRGLLARGMAKNPADRPADAAEFVAELEDMAFAAYGPGWEQRGRSQLRERAAALALLFLGGAVAGGAGTATAESWFGGKAGRHRAVASGAGTAAAESWFGRQARRARRRPAATGAIAAAAIAIIALASAALANVNAGFSTPHAAASSAAAASGGPGAAPAGSGASTGSATSAASASSTGTAKPTGTASPSGTASPTGTASPVGTGSPTGTGTSTSPAAAPGHSAAPTTPGASTPSYPPLSITTGSLPPGTAGTAYSAVLSASGGHGPYGWTLLSGAPAGFQLSGGRLSGTTSAVGSYQVRAEVTDSQSPARRATVTLPLTIDAPVALTVVSAPITVFVGGSPYLATFSASGGSGSYTWSWSGSPSTPPGLSIDPATGEISGSPSTGGAYTVTVTVTDSEGRTSQTTFTIMVEVIQ